MLRCIIVPNMVNIPTHRKRTFIREWRKYRGLTLEQLGARIGMTASNLSMLERGQRGYTQPALEAIAEALQTDPASLLMRDPMSPDAIWTLWDQASQAERRQIVEIARALRRTGTAA
jgi:transcriptional regulator with XRE-family HTH domain